ncbi:MAG: putative porin [Gammaproteobacteria bacterium]|nr:putative porin [Gammaproteobacteria bacterium]
MEQLRSSTLDLIRMLVQEDVISREKAEALIKRAEAEQAKTELARAELAKAEVARAELAKVELAKAEQAKAELAKIEQAIAERAKVEQAIAEQAQAELARLEQAKAELAKLEQAKAEQTKAEQTKAEQAKAELAQVNAAKVDAAKDAPNVVRVQYVPKHVKDQMREEIKNEVMAKAQAEGWAAPGAMPEWIGRIAWEGDLRLRYEKDRFPAGNETPINLALQGITINNTSEDRDRLRLRARLGAKLNIADNVSGGIRLTTGNAGDPVSPNQTFGDSYTTSSKFNFALDRAYLKYTPASWLSFSGGRIENPWLHTDLVWDPDFAFDGVVSAMRPKIGDNLTGFATLGAFPIQEVESNGSTVLAKNRWLYGAQVGFEWMSANQSAYKLGLAYYDFTNIQGVLNGLNSTARNQTARQFHQKGNTVFDITNPQVSYTTDLYGLASKFREVDLTGVADIAAFNPVHVVLTGDYVKNIGFKESEVQALNPVSPVGGNKGWMAKLLVGMPEAIHRNDWNVSAAYKRLETNAVLDAYTDSDFHLGGTNAKGWIVGGNYGLDKNTWLNLRWFSADQIVGSPLAIDVLMLDLNAKF